MASQRAGACTKYDPRRCDRLEQEASGLEAGGEDACAERERAEGAGAA